MPKTAPRDKALRDGGLAALCDSIRAIRSSANAAVVRLGELMANGFQEVEDALNDFPKSTPVTLPVTGWTKDEAGSAKFPYCYDIPVENVTAADRAAVTILPVSYEAAVACGLCPANETLDPPSGTPEGQPQIGKIRIRAASIPEAEITAEYWVENGKE